MFVSKKALDRRLIPIVLAVSLGFSSSIFAETWFQISHDMSEIACPDVVEIKRKHYEIRNECYGDSKDEYRLEEGELHISNSQVEFLNRSVFLRSFLQGKAKQVTLGFAEYPTGEIRLYQGKNQYSFIRIE